MASVFRKASLIISERNLVCISNQFPTDWPEDIDEWKITEWSVTPENKRSPRIFDVTLVLKRKDQGSRKTPNDMIKQITIGYETFGKALELVTNYLGRESGHHKINTTVDLTIDKRSITILWSFNSDSHPMPGKFRLDITHDTSNSIH